MKIPCLLAMLLLFVFGKAATVDTISIYSASMHKEWKCVVISPFVHGQKQIPVPTVYLLHGYSGCYSDWIKKVPRLQQYADQLQLRIVCPDGGYSSWYFDSPVDSSMRYETYISKEVPEYIDCHYLTIHDRKARAITGLSMGGHGALFLAFRHADVFGACGSMSGGVDMSTLKRRFDVSKRLGDTLKNENYWHDLSVLNVVERYPKDSLAIIFDCGINDIFYTENQNLHHKMLALKIPHDYIERPGKHNWDYWSNSVQYQLIFFRNYFDRIKTKL